MNLTPLYIIFDGPPSHESGRFVEVETAAGHSVTIPGADWSEYDGHPGLWRLGPIPVAMPAPADGDSNIEPARRLAALDDEIATLEAVLRDRKERRTATEEQVLTIFEREGVQNMRVGGRTLYLTSTIRARANPETGGTEALADALRADPETAPLVKDAVNANTLSAWVRERLDQGEELPADIAPHVITTTIHKVGSRH